MFLLKIDTNKQTKWIWLSCQSNNIIVLSVMIKVLVYLIINLFSLTTDSPNKDNNVIEIIMNDQWQYSKRYLWFLLTQIVSSLLSSLEFYFYPVKRSIQWITMEIKAWSGFQASNETVVKRDFVTFHQIMIAF